MKGSSRKAKRESRADSSSPQSKTPSASPKRQKKLQKRSISTTRQQSTISTSSINGGNVSQQNTHQNHTNTQNQNQKKKIQGNKFPKLNQQQQRQFTDLLSPQSSIIKQSLLSNNTLSETSSGPTLPSNYQQQQTRRNSSSSSASFPTPTTPTTSTTHSIKSTTITSSSLHTNQHLAVSSNGEKQQNQQKNKFFFFGNNNTPIMTGNGLILNLTSNIGSNYNTTSSQSPSRSSTNSNTLHSLPLLMTASTSASVGHISTITHQKRTFITLNNGQHDQTGQNGQNLLKNNKKTTQQKKRKFSTSVQEGEDEKKNQKNDHSINQYSTEDIDPDVHCTSWSTIDQENAREILDTIEDLDQSVVALGHFLAGEESLPSLVVKYGGYINLTDDFIYDNESPFSEAVQRSNLYGTIPLNLRKMKKYKKIPENFDRGNYVATNLHKFHTSSFPSDIDILTVMNQDEIYSEVQLFFQDLQVEQYAKAHDLGFIGSTKELQKAIRRKILRDESYSQPKIAPQHVLNLLPEQMEALDSLLGFALPKLTSEHTNQIMIAHLKQKAEDLTREYNSDPFRLHSVKKRHEIEHAENQIAIHQANLDAEMTRFLTNQGKNIEEDNKRQELILKRQQIIEDLQVEIIKQKQKKKDLPTITPEAFNTIRRLPQTVTVNNIDKASDILKKSIQIVQAPGELDKTVRAEANKKRLKNNSKPSWMKRLSAHYQLTKPRISQMVGVTALWGYWSVGNPTDWKDLALLTSGTVALSSAASIINQIRETDVDAKMTRTMSRPLVTKIISIESAKKQVAAYTAIGSALLFPFTTIVPVLGLSNIALYGGLYTSLKRKTPLNTEIGAIVGAIPPMMGYFAALGPDQAWDANLTALLFPAAMMVAWQIQHVMLICVRRGEEYNRSGLIMQCKDDPGLKTTINKGIAWSVISTVVSSIPFFTGHADLTQLFSTYLWALYTVPYAIAMRKQDQKRLGQILLAGYVLLGFTLMFSLNAQVPADTWGFLFTDGPQTPSPLTSERPTLSDVMFRGAGTVGLGGGDATGVGVENMMDAIQNFGDSSSSSSSNTAIVTNIDNVDDVIDISTSASDTLPTHQSGTGAVAAASSSINSNPQLTSNGPQNGTGNVKMASIPDEIMVQNKSKLIKLTEFILNMNNTPSSQDDI